MVRLSPAVLVLAVALPARPEPPSQEPLFHPNPDHIWNRLHRHVYLRDDKTNTVDGRERLSPLPFAPVSTFLTKGQSHRDAIALLDEFLKAAPERRIREPLKRAVLQHDLWEAFTSTTEGAREYVFADSTGRVLKAQQFVDPGDAGLDDRQPRREVQKRLVQAIRAVALTPREIEALPDNLAVAVKAGAFPKQFDPEHPDRLFLPPDLLAKDGPWVAVASATRSDELAAPAHMADAKGRAVFTVFLRLPEGRKATEAYVKRMTDGALPELPEGAQTALLRRWLLIDDQGRPRESPLTESLQLRVYWKDELGRPFALRLRRGELFAGRDGGVKPLQLRGENCASCHARIEGQGVRTIATLYAGESNKPGLIAVEAAKQPGNTIVWLQKTYTWGLLQGLWEAEPAK
jgi:hypothetical protein